MAGALVVYRLERGRLIPFHDGRQTAPDGVNGVQIPGNFRNCLDLFAEEAADGLEIVYMVADGFN